MAKPTHASRRDELLAQFKRLARETGGVPGIREFLKASGAKKHFWDGNLWPSWRAFLVEAGFEANELTQAFDDDAMMRPLAVLTRSHQRFPTVRELKFARVNDPSMPSEKTYRNRFTNQAEMIARLSEWVGDKSEWDDVRRVLSVIENVKAQVSATSAASVAAGQPVTVLLSDSYVPPIVAALDQLAAGAPAALMECEAKGVDPNVEFERRVGIAFELLGLDVERLGQGAGRVADGIARCRSARWALIYDAKLRRAGFALGTEDRKFREYVEHHGRVLLREGVESIYFAVVSSTFSKKDIERAQQLVHATFAKAVPLIEASALREMVDARMRRRLDDPARLQQLVGLTQIVTADHVRERWR